MVAAVPISISGIITNSQIETSHKIDLSHGFKILCGTSWPYDNISDVIDDMVFVLSDGSACSLLVFITRTFTVVGVPSMQSRALQVARLPSALRTEAERSNRDNEEGESIVFTTVCISVRNSSVMKSAIRVARFLKTLFVVPFDSGLKYAVLAPVFFGTEDNEIISSMTSYLQALPQVNAANYGPEQPN